ncbi:MAG: aldo/keto reductase [Bacteroidota bacterium]|nr:aldo/keto reductase [Bacteroidota bacterium]
MKNRIITILALIFSIFIANAQNTPKVPMVKLNNGMEMPQLGVGTFLVKEDAVQRVSYAIKVGFRLIDVAQGYGNEKEVGEGIRQSGIDRSELFVTTKINTTEMRNGTVRESLDKSLADLATGYIDLVLIHWPVEGKIKETWQILEEYIDKGLIRCIGVSNFNPHHLDDLLEYARIQPVVNQIEVEPYLTQQKVVGYTFQKGIQVQAWGPLGQGITGVLEDPVIGEIATRHGKSIAQVILRWHMQRGLVTIPRCDNDAHTEENIRIFDFELSPAEMEIISGLNRDQRSNSKNDPDNFPW